MKTWLASGKEFSGLRFAVFQKFIAPHEFNCDNIAFLMLCMWLQLLEALPRNSGMITSRNRRDAKRIQSVASKCMINKREMGDALFFRAFSAHARRSVCVFSRGMREGEFNNAAGKWRRVFRDSRLWKEFRTYNKRHNANTSRQKSRLERAQAATLLRGNILMRKHWSANIQSVVILHAKRNSWHFSARNHRSYDFYRTVQTF